MSDETVEDSQRKRFSPVAVVLALFVMYPLSVGPVIWILKQIGVNIAPRWFEVLYYPVFWVTQRLPWLQWIADEYRYFLIP